MAIEARHVSKTFANYPALHDVSLRVNDGELIALLGPSGSGKTTLLRIIAGLDSPDENSSTEVLVDGEDISRQPASSRRVGFVFQHYALFKHMTVFENVAFGLRVRPRKLRLSRARTAPQSQRTPRTHSTRPLVKPLPLAAFRRSAAARRPRPRPRHRTQRPPARRTLRRSRRQSPAGTPPLASHPSQPDPGHQRPWSLTIRKKRSKWPTGLSS